MPSFALAVAYALAVLVLAATAIALTRRRPPPSEFIVDAPLPLPAVAPAPNASYVHPPGAGVAHAVTATTLPDGRVAAYWFAGSREGAKDVTIRMSALTDGVWTAPRAIMDRRRMGAVQRRFIKTVGNPVVLRHPSGEYWLIVVSVSFGGWSGSALNLIRSRDGLEWGAPERLWTSPFANVSTLAKGAALLRTDGLVALPVYHEFAAAYPELILIDAGGAVVDKGRLGGRNQIQPWVVARDGRRAVALMRAFGRAARRLWQAKTDDGGRSWQPMPATLANPDSPAAAVLLPGGRIAAVLNDDGGSAETLDLVVSDDGGAGWRHLAPVFGAKGRGGRYRYPWLMQDGQGRVHVFATEGTNAIRHAVIGAEAFDAAAEGGRR